MQFQRKHFDPAPVGEVLADGHVSCRFEDADGRVSLYVYDPRLILALNVALAARRPLLLAGEPGCGKTSLARNVAKVLGWWYYQQTVSSRTQAADLLWEYDALRRLNDAYVRDRDVLPDHCYVQPGALWWAMAPDTAAVRGWAALPEAYHLTDPGEPGAHNHALILLDEIDKAEPDVPNDLLEILDTRSFNVKDVAIKASRPRTLVILTTNGERELPGAFLRRCVTYRFPEPDLAWFEQVAQRWLPQGDPQHHHDVAVRLIAARKRAHDAGHRMPGTAEYLDALRAFAELGLTVGSEAWQEVERCVFDKMLALDTAAGSA